MRGDDSLTPPRADIGTIDISLGFDSKYAPHAAAVIASVVRHAPGAKLRFIVLHSGVEPARQAMVEMTAPGAQFVWVEIGDEDVPAFADWGHFTRATLFRLGLEKLAPADCDRVIYLDADIIVLRDVRDLWSADLGGAPIGAIPDLYQGGEEFAERWSLQGAPRYFNAGVLLIDLARVRAERSFTAAGDFLAQQGKLKHNDQDALNWAFWGRWREVDAAWNVQRFLKPGEVAREFPERGKGPALVHYIGKYKPWERNAWHPWSWLYWDNLKRTPFYEEVTKTYAIDLKQRLRLRARWLLRALAKPAQLEGA
jgi:lipopolysaccharide biosynthesis glycosyltransferase